MPRQRRLDAAHVPQHRVQRGNDRQPCFYNAEDRACYLNDLREITFKQGCAVHAYVLMSNHVHLLMTPGAIGQVGHIMQSLGRRYVRYINDRYHRTGTLWESRYKACLVDTRGHLLRCYRYIELNPVRAAMVAQPGDYPWSSYAHNALGKHDPLVRPHATYLTLASSAQEFCAAYASFVAQALDESEIDDIRLHLQRQHAFGSSRFRARIEMQLGRRAGPAKIGRPTKQKASEENAL